MPGVRRLLPSCGGRLKPRDREPGRVRAIMAATGMAWEIAEPYPDFIGSENGGKYTFAWCIRRTADACIFLQDGRCSVYAHRPWICRTYPFMLLDDVLQVSECPGLGMPLTADVAHDVATELCKRQAAEAVEETGVRKVYQRARIPPGRRVVIDSEGMKVPWLNPSHQTVMSAEECRDVGPLSKSFSQISSVLDRQGRLIALTEETADPRYPRS